ncbi:MAG: DUF2298 domain-containing protein [Ardenticatenia bacterium]|nr:DUF2298 domain-containing protein [Ardenticatenia bacterium]
MIQVLRWYLVITAFGWAAAPLAFTWLRRLPDRGWGVTRPLGWMLAGYAVWLLAYFDMARVNAGNGVGALLLVALGSLIVLDRWGEGWSAWWGWLRARWRLIVVEEGLFLAAFAAWAFVRAHDNAIMGTEKPMEFAFLNSIVRGGTVPPADPWMSGYAISYYYFGYLLLALLTTMSRTPTPVAFNLSVALLFALTLTAAFSLTYNVARTVTDETTAKRAGGFGALLTGVAGNLEGLFEVLNANGIGSEAFYRWLDIKNLVKSAPTGTWYPTEFWWWWRASRVIRDRAPLTGADQEVITEFPFFSFLLGDVHPHVLALPFVLLVLSVAFATLRAAWLSEKGTSPFLSAGSPAWATLSFLLTAWALGGLAFLNAWDFPTMSLIVLAAWLVGHVAAAHPSGRSLVEAVFRAGTLPVVGIVLYVPFFIGLQSQAKGLGLVIGVATRVHQYLIIHGLFYWVWIAVLFTLLPVARQYPVDRWRLGWTAFMVLWVLLSLVLRNSTAVLIATVVWASGWLLGACLRALAPPEPAGKRAGEGALPLPRDPTGVLFVLLAGSVAMGITLATEFVFVRDVFGTRMNTVFKFYYQAWVLLSVASAFGTVWLWRRLPSAGRAVWGLGFSALVGAVLLYPVAATWSKTNRFQGPATLDGLAWFRQARPADAAVITWLNTNVSGQPTILEATGPQYSEYARVATMTGLPTVLGWGGHELQWRGTYEEPGRREPIIARIYQTEDAAEARRLMEEFNVRYVVVGRLERQAYGLSDAQVEKFRAFMAPVVEYQDMVLFAR